MASNLPSSSTVTRVSKARSGDITLSNSPSTNSVNFVRDAIFILRSLTGFELLSKFFESKRSAILRALFDWITILHASAKKSAGLWPSMMDWSSLKVEATFWHFSTDVSWQIFSQSGVEVTKSLLSFFKSCCFELTNQFQANYCQFTSETTGHLYTPSFLW